MKIQLSDHFTAKKLLLFTLPSIVMMIVSSIYSIVDGLFVSNLVGEMALSSINIIFPIIMIVGSFGFMLGAGGSAIVAKTLGEGKKELANSYFSFLMVTVFVCGLVLSVIGIIFMEPLARLAGASDVLLEDCIIYGRILLAGVSFFMLQNIFQSFLVVTGKPHLGLILSIAAGITNMVLDYLFIGPLHMGIAGAALATVMGYLVGGLLPIFYFLKKREDGLYLVKPKWYGTILLRACTNGSSEMMSNISASIVGILFNIQLMRYLGEPGVAAFAVMMYVDFIFLGTFLGFSFGSAPVISYHYGAGNHAELQNLFRKSLWVIGVVSVAMQVFAQLLSRPLSFIFVGYNDALLDLTVHGFRLFALNYIVCGINIFSSSLFTALCNGRISALLSFLRAFLLRGGMVLLLPVILGVDGIWLSPMLAELIGAILSVFFLIRYRRQYHYTKA